MVAMGGILGGVEWVSGDVVGAVVLEWGVIDSCVTLDVGARRVRIGGS